MKLLNCLSYLIQLGTLNAVTTCVCSMQQHGVLMRNETSLCNSNVIWIRTFDNPSFHLCNLNSSHCSELILADYRLRDIGREKKTRRKEKRERGKKKVEKKKKQGST